MKRRLLILGASLFATLVLLAPLLFAGPEPYTGSKEAAPPSITESEPWQFTIAAPGWVAGLDGTIGVRGVNADINIAFDQILQHLDMIFAMRAEAQKGPFGIYGEVIYIGLSHAPPTTRLVNNLPEQVAEPLADAALPRRLVTHPPWPPATPSATHYT